MQQHESSAVIENWATECGAGIRFSARTIRYFSPSRMQWLLGTLHSVNAATASSSPHTFIQLQASLLGEFFL
jgi:hypothetical protein